MRTTSLSLSLALVLLLCSLYAFGVGGIFFIDDASTLDGLLGVSDAATAVEYLLTGSSGPLGRPVALASFLLQKDAYPHSTTPFVWFNILLHALNACVLGLLVRRLQFYSPVLARASETWLAPAVAFLWASLPILATTSLMVVQRMTSLSALFALLGMHSYLWARDLAAQGARVKFVAVLGLFLACYAMSFLSKENGVLMPWLLLVMRHTLLANTESSADHQPASSRWRSWLLELVLWVPVLAVLGHLLSLLPHIDAAYGNRAFTWQERLASEVVILWEYLRVGFLPSLADLSPFRDDYPVRHFSDLAVQVALLAWGTVLALAWWLWRRRRPLLLFALLWYLAGHLLESGIVPLFLYFDHRNYVPLMGPVLALCVWMASWRRLPKLWLGLLTLAYAAFLSFTLWQTSSLWGQRQLLVWAKEHPDSPRALQMIAGAYMQTGRVKEVESMYEAALQRNPKLTSVATQGMRAACYLSDGGLAVAKWKTYAQRSLPEGDFSHLTIASLDATSHLVMQRNCGGLSASDVFQLAQSLAANARFSAPTAQVGLHEIMTNLALTEGDTQEAKKHLQRIVQLQPDIESIKLLTQLIRSTEGDAAVREFLRSILISPPPFKLESQRRRWRNELEKL